MSQITVYQTDADGAFLHATVANELPLTPGLFNVPFGAKLTAPPDAPAGHVAVAVGSDWITQEDHRSESLYLVSTGAPYALKTTLMLDAGAVRYTGLGTIPDWLTDQAPVVQEEKGEEWENSDLPENE